MKRFILLTAVLLGLFTALLSAAPAPLNLPEEDHLSAGDAILLGIVEGFTEYLPVSSTGHLLLTQRLLGIGNSPEDQAAADSFVIIIQFGAILAILSVYTDKIRYLFLGLLGRSEEGKRLLINLLVAFLPAAVLGLLFVDWIKAVLFGLWPVTFAWFVGGFALVVFRSRGEAAQGNPLETLRPRQAFLVGMIQCVAMWPGTSRSLVTILGGRLVGLSVEASVIFSFLLGAVTLSAGTAYDLLKHGDDLFAVFGAESLLLGVFTGWVSALLAVKWMVAYLQKHGLALFGFYRMGLAVLTAALLCSNVIQS